jgi:hypothetical protein
MSQQTDIQTRLDWLRSGLREETSRYLKLARRNYYFAYALMGLTLASSIAASAAAFAGWSKEAVGLLALMPGFLAVIATGLKLQERANWHYRKYDDLNGLLRRALFDLPEMPTAADIAEVSHAWTKLDKDMSVEWENKLALDWSQAQSAGRKDDTQ